jgi:hypothetical protein
MEFEGAESRTKVEQQSVAPMRAIRAKTLSCTAGEPAASVVSSGGGKRREATKERRTLGVTRKVRKRQEMSAFVNLAPYTRGWLETLALAIILSVAPVSTGTLTGNPFGWF